MRLILVRLVWSHKLALLKTIKIIVFSKNIDKILRMHTVPSFNIMGNLYPLGHQILLYIIILIIE